MTNTVDNEKAVHSAMSLFTRKVGTCEYDDVCPKCPKGVATILADYQQAITFSEHGI